MNNAEWFKHLKIMEITLFWFQNNAPLNLFRAALFKLIFVLHEDVLFHCRVKFFYSKEYIFKMPLP